MVSKIKCSKITIAVRSSGYPDDRIFHVVSILGKNFYVVRVLVEVSKYHNPSFGLQMQRRMELNAMWKKNSLMGLAEISRRDLKDCMQ